MNPFIKYLIQRTIYMVITLILITGILYGAIILLLPPEVRAMAYMPSWQGMGNMENFIESTISKYQMRDPFPVQYGIWLISLLRGDWGISTTMYTDVLEVLLQRTPATAELLLLSLLLFIPAGLFSGVLTGWRRNSSMDWAFRLTAFVATSVPTFILGLMLLAYFYIGLKWFPAGRISIQMGIEIGDPAFRSYTNLIMLDGLLNGRLDVSLDAFRHLFLPALTLSITYWAILGRITRVTMIEELHEDYIVTARGKGLHNRDVLWRHAFRNAAIPGLNSIALSAAMFLTNAIIVEIIFGFPGVSKPLSRALSNTNYVDVNMAMGFAVYSTLLVLPVMLILDIITALIDPRIREGLN